MKNKQNIVMYDGLYFTPAIMIAFFCAIALIPIVSFGHYQWILPLVLIPFLLLNILNFVEINFENRQHRNGISFFGKKFGKWENIPKIEYVSIVGLNMKTVGSNARGMITPGILINETVSHYSSYEIRLFSSYRKKVNLKRLNTAKKAIKLGKLIADGLNEKLLDATAKPPVFIE